jgi:predicted PurR-regulated permease PerM
MTVYEDQNAELARADVTTGGHQAPPLTPPATQLSWRALGRRLRSITPAALARFLLVLGVLLFLARILSAASAAVLPFVFGAVVAYLLLPLVDLLARRLPRPAAILLIFFASSIVLIGAVAYSIPVLVDQVGVLLEALPDREDISVLLDRVGVLVAGLPAPVQSLIQESAPEIYETIQTNVGVYLQSAFRFLPGVTADLLNTFSFLLGFLAVPLWLFYALKDAHQGRHLLDRMLPQWMRADVWAVLRIVNRVLHNYIRAQVILSLVVGICVFLGLNLLSWLGVEGIHSTLVLAIIAGLTETITIIGPLLGAIPAVLMGLLTSWQTALAIVILYALIQQFENTFLVPLITGDTLNIHPAILILIIVVASQFGLIYMVLAAPLAAVVRDLFLYAYGRLADPPARAGVLPGDPVPVATTSPAESPARAASPVLVDPAE